MEVIGAGGFLNHTWYHDGTVVGSNSKGLQFYPVTYADSGYYWCVITNDLGTITSDSIHLAVADSFTVTATTPADSICYNAPAIILEGNPTGGFFSGDGLMIDSFYPTFAGDGLHEIIYTVNQN